MLIELTKFRAVLLIAGWLVLISGGILMLTVAPNVAEATSPAEASRIWQEGLSFSFYFGTLFTIPIALLSFASVLAPQLRTDA